MRNAPVVPSLKSLSASAGKNRGYYSIAEVAALLGVSRVSVWRWISSGRLPVTRLGHRTVRVKREDLALLMKTPPRKSAQPEPPATVDAVRAESPRPGAADHFVLFYDSDRYLIDGVADFIGPALDAGESAVVVATAAHRADIEARLQAAGIDVQLAAANGRYVAADAAQTLARFMVNGVADPARFDEVLRGLLSNASASNGTGGRPRIFGEMVALLVADGMPDAAVALETLWNLAAKKRPFALMCAYPMQQLGAASLTSVLSDVCTEHSTVLPTESYATLDDDDARLRAIAALQQKAAALEREVAERRAVEEQLQVALAAERVARSEVEAALHLREEFLSIASHELRTPITIMGAHSQMSLRRLERTGELDIERMRQTLRTMGSQANKLGRLVGQLLDVTRLDGDKLQLDLQSSNLALVVGQVVSASRALTDKHEISLTAPDEVECILDELRLEQVLTNLIDNAIKYSPAGGPVDVVVRQPDVDTVELSVRDYGLGIPVENRGRIFEQFYQAHGTSHRSGMGLGLYICRHIVELHGGDIRAEFPPDGGTRVIVRLPMARAAASASAAG